MKIVPARTHLFRRLSLTDTTFISSSGRILQCTGLTHGMYTTENRFAINSFFTRFVLYYIVNDTENSPMDDKQNICQLQATELLLSQLVITKFDKLRHSQFLGNTRISEKWLTATNKERKFVGVSTFIRSCALRSVAVYLLFNFVVSGLYSVKLISQFQRRNKISVLPGKK